MPIRVLSGPYGSAVASDATAPGYLIAIDLAQIVRLCTRATMAWNGYTWSESDVSVSNIGRDQSARQSASIRIGDVDLLFSALFLNNEVADAPIQIWSFDDAAVDVADPMLVFDGVGDEVSYDAGSATMSVTLLPYVKRVAAAPRRVISRLEGFRHTTPKGTIVNCGGEKYILEADNHG